MKKILPVILLLVLFALPVSADALVNVVVNGKTLDTPGLLINNSTYVPLRAVTEGLGANVDWDGSQAIVNTVPKAATETASVPKIVGAGACQADIEAVLQLLKEKSPADYEMVCKYVKAIMLAGATPNDSDNSDFNPLGYTVVPIKPIPGAKTDTIFLTASLYDKKDNIYTASVIVHEATHLCNFHGNITPASKEDENVAHLRGIATLRILGASQQLIDGAERTREQAIK